MRQFVFAFWHGFLGLFRLGIAWIPTSLIAIWGVFYLSSCVQAVLAPGRAFHFSYVAEDGQTVNLDGKAYSYDPATQRLLVDTLTLGRKKQRPLLEVRRLLVKLDKGDPKIEVWGVTGLVERGLDGQFSVSQFAPKSEPGAPPPSFEMVAHDVELKYRDMSASPPLTQPIFIPEASLASALGAMAGKAAFGLAKSKPRDIKFDFSMDKSNAYSVRATIANTDLAPLVSIAKPWLPKTAPAELKSLTFSEGRLDGTLLARGTGSAAPTLEGEANVTAKHLNYGVNVQDAGGQIRLIARGQGVRTVGSVEAKGTKITFDGLGNLATMAWAGNVVAVVNRPQSLPLALVKVIPKDLSFTDARYEGWVEWDGKTAQAQGKLAAANATYQGYSAEKLDSKISFADHRLVAQVDGVSVKGYRVAGAVEVDTITQSLNGFVRNLDQKSNFSFKSPDGRVGTISGSIEALISGKLSQPVLIGEFDGAGNWDGQNLGRIQARLSGDTKALTLDRALLTGSSGSLTATGTINLSGQTLALNIQSSAVNLGKFVPDIDGRGYFKGTVSGSFKDPHLMGRVEAYNIQSGQNQVPEVTANLSASLHEILLKDGQVRYAGGRILAKGIYNLDTTEIAGSFSGTGLLLDELVRQDVEGRISIEEGSVNGTLKHPQAAAKIKAGDILGFGYSLDSFNATATLDQDLISIDDIVATSKSGDVMGTANFDLQEQIGWAQLSVDGLPLEQYHSGDGSLPLSGIVSGTINASFGADFVPFVTLGGTIQDLRVASMDVGGGTWDGEFFNNQLTATALVGSVDRYIDLQSLDLNLTDKTINLKTLVANIELREILKGTKSSILKLNPDQEKLVDNWSGDINASVVVSGSLDNPNLHIQNLTTNKLAYGARRLGKLKADVAHVDKVWNFDLGWADGGFSLASKGTVADAGAIKAEANLTNFDLSLVSLVFPDSQVLKGNATVFATAAGTTDNPEVKGYLLLNGLGYRTAKGDVVDLPLSVELGDILYRDKVATISGDATYQGLSAKVEATVPLNSVTVNPTQSFDAKLTLSRRQVQSVEEYVSFLDTKATHASFLGEVSAKGNRDLFRLNGFLKVEGETPGTLATLKFKDAASPFENSSLLFAFSDKHVDLKASGSNKAGGNFNLDVAAETKSPIGQDFSVDRLLDESSLKGQLSLSKLFLKGALMAADKPSEATADGLVTLSGSPRKPLIAGHLDLTKTTVVLPTEFPQGEGQTNFTVNPMFQGFLINAELGTTLVASTGKIRLFGTGVLNGTLAEPDFRAPLVVQDGVFQLPTRRVNLDSGTITASYSGSPRVARADLDLKATTIATKAVTTVLYQTYNINLNIKGNLLSNGGLKIDGVSDPPDLTNDEIMALIGEQSLLEGLGNSISNQQNRGVFRDAFYTLAVPSLTSGITESIAQDLKLDYLTLDYNPFDLAIIRGGKTIAKGLMLQGSKQISQPLVGRQRYELKLSYQLPLKDRFLSRFRLGFGIDQDNPWKLSLDWSTRF